MGRRQPRTAIGESHLERNVDVLRVGEIGWRDSVKDDSGVDALIADVNRGCNGERAAEAESG